MRYIILLFLGLLGCSDSPSLSIYSLNIPTIKSTSKIHKNRTIIIAYPQSITEDITNRIVFNYSSSQQGVYQNSQWSSTIGRLLQASLIDTIHDTKRYKAVLADNSIIGADYKLEINIFALHHHIRGKESSSIVSIGFNLIDISSTKLIKSRRFSYSQPTVTTDAKGYVEATNKAIERLSIDLLRWL